MKEVILTIDKVKQTSKTTEFWFREDYDIFGEGCHLSAKTKVVKDALQTSDLLQESFNNGYKGLITQWVCKADKWELAKFLPRYKTTEEIIRGVYANYGHITEDDTESIISELMAALGKNELSYTQHGVRVTSWEQVCKLVNNRNRDILLEDIYKLLYHLSKVKENLPTVAEAYFVHFDWVNDGMTNPSVTCVYSVRDYPTLSKDKAIILEIIATHLEDDYGTTFGKALADLGIIEYKDGCAIHIHNTSDTEILNAILDKRSTKELTIKFKEHTIFGKHYQILSELTEYMVFLAAEQGLQERRHSTFGQILYQKDILVIGDSPSMGLKDPALDTDDAIYKRMKKSSEDAF